MSVRGFVHLTDRAVLRIAGAGSTKFLQDLSTQDIRMLSRRSIAPTAFLSPKGRVLCDALVEKRQGEEYFLDCHRSMIPPLMRFLLRHRLRERFIIEDASKSHTVIAELPPQALSPEEGMEQPQEAIVAGFVPDPRYAALGRRALVTSEEAVRLLAMVRGGLLGLEAYHKWRLCCAVPEGPSDLPPDSALPFNSNLDLLGFLCFNKGCYIGQELTARTNFRGAVRRRFFSAVSGGVDPQALLQRLNQDISVPLLLAELCDASGPELPKGSQNLTLPVVSREKGKDWKRTGALHSRIGRIGLCLLRGRVNLKKPEELHKVELSDGVEFAVQGVPIVLRPPPYAQGA